MASARHRVLVVGAGVAGLALAAGLRRVGAWATVYERGPGPTSGGAGVLLWSNGLAALRRLGAHRELLEGASELEHVSAATDRGEPLGVAGLSGLGGERPSLCTTAAELVGALREAADPSHIEYHKELTGFTADADGVTAHFADDTDAQGALLVGADGPDSTVRAALWRDGPARPTGCVAVHGLSARAVPAGTLSLVVGPAAQFGVAPLGPRRSYWYAVLAGFGGVPTDPLAEACRRCVHWPEPACAVLEAAEVAFAERVLDRPARWPRGAGRGTLAGDAARPQRPSLSQGVCQALEDAVALASAVQRDGLTAAAARSYERARRVRADWVSREARRLGGILQWGCAPAVWLRRHLAHSPLLRRRGEATLRRLLGYESPELV